MNETADVAIIGCGVMGASAAYWLTEMDPSLDIKVIERDPSHERSSTALSVASIRQQFSAPVNVRISQFGLEFIRGFSERTAEVGGVDLGFRGNGYLFLAGSTPGAQTLRQHCAMQNSEGAGTSLHSAHEIQRRFPWMDTKGVTLASFGGDTEGWFDNMGLLSGLRSMAKARGVEFITGEVVSLEQYSGKIRTVGLADGTKITVGSAINAAGPCAAEVLGMLGQEFPVEARKRTVFVVDAPGARHPDAPLIVDYQGYYARPEGDVWITAMVPENDAAVSSEDFAANHWEFEEFIWPKLYARMPGFEAAKVLRHWVGHYAFNTVDQNAIVGSHPIWSNLYLANGFSGHGLQQAPAVGRGLAELIVHGEYRSLDLSELGMERILDGRPILETAVV